MASYTLNTTAAEETVVTRARIEANAIEGGPQYATNGAFLLAVLRERMMEIYNAQKRVDKAKYEDRLAIATQAEKDAIAAALGLPAGTL